MNVDLGLFMLRLVIGGLLWAHGAQKLFGWFGGFGLNGTGAYLASLGFRPGRAFAVLAGLAEAAGGLLLALGLFTPLAGATLLGVLLVVGVAGHGSRGVWSHQGGYEYPLVLAVVVSAVAFAGPGAYALDNLLPGPATGADVGLAATLVGLAGGTLALLARRGQLSDSTPAA